MKMNMHLPVILSEFADPDNKNQRRGKTREWIKRKQQLDSFQNIIKELNVEDRCAFNEMFRKNIEDFETVRLMVRICL